MTTTNSSILRVLLDSSSIPWDQKDFPKDLCTNNSTEFPGVVDSLVEFICILVDRRFSTSLRLMALKPYFYEDEGQVFFGWYDDSNGTPYSHCVNSDAPHADEHVVAWRKI
jgi:hypothetical protein